MLDPDLESLLKSVGGNKYKLAVIAAKLAHKIELEGKASSVKPLSLALSLLKENKPDLNRKA